MEQTKGYLRLKGKIWNLNNKDAKETQYNRWLSFGLQTNKDNSIFLQVGDKKDSSLTIKIKGEGMEQVEEVKEQDAIKRVKELFKDGDSVYINARVNVNSYFKSIGYVVNQIYIEKDALDFNAADFQETNELNQTVIITEKPENKTVKVGLTTFKGEMVEQELKLSDEDVNDFFVENVKVGDALRVTISVNRKPNYVEGSEETSSSSRKTLKGKTVTSGGKRKIDGYTESLEVIDVDLEKTEKQKYTRDDIREAFDKAEIKPKKNTHTEVEEDDLPY